MKTLLLLSMLLVPHHVKKDPHSIRMVKVQAGVSIETVDWGGKGAPLIFLAGLTNTAHVFDEFAPRFTNKYHVIGITRRGFGASSLAPDGYDAGRLSEDIVAVLDSLKIKKAVFVGHSIAGDEMTTLATNHPDRVRGLIYLDAAYDHSPVMKFFAKYPGPQAEPIGKSTGVSAARLRQFYIDNYNAPTPINELYQVTNFDSAGHATGDKPNAHDKVWAAVQPISYRGVKAPVLAFYGVLESGRAWYPHSYDNFSADDKVRADSLAVAFSRFTHDNMNQLRSELPNARIVKLFGTGHYVFALEPKRVASEMRVYLASLK